MFCQLAAPYRTVVVHVPGTMHQTCWPRKPKGAEWHAHVSEECVSWAETSSSFYKRTIIGLSCWSIGASVVAKFPTASKHPVTHLIFRFCWWELSGCQPWSWELSVWFLQIWEDFSSLATPRRWHGSTRIAVFFSLGRMEFLKVTVLWSNLL